MSDAESDRHLVNAVRHAYDESADGWQAGPVPVYRTFARALVEACPRPLADRLVLDLGAGTGVASEVLAQAGARPVAVDLAFAMLRQRQEQRPPGAVGDAQALPFRDGSFDAVVAAFSLNHLPDPAAGLAECRRVTCPGGMVLASSFPSDAEHPAKAIVEAALEQFGYQRPAWYQTFKNRLVALTGDSEALEQAAREAGLADVSVVRLDVDAGLDSPELALEWRLHMPHTMSFVAGLDAGARAALRSRALTVLSRDLPSRVPILVLCAHVP
jgi:ubiquinone/menaquinone biosynthesis C-methylase UbiE